MALIKGFQATSFWKAFVLNALANTIIVLVAMFLKSEFEKLQHDNVPALSPALIVAVIGSTFLAALIAYAALYFTFGFGGGMLVVEAPKDSQDKTFSIHVTEKNHKTGKTKTKLLPIQVK